MSSEDSDMSNAGSGETTPTAPNFQGVAQPHQAPVYPYVYPVSANQESYPRLPHQHAAPYGHFTTHPMGHPSHMGHFPYAYPYGSRPVMQGYPLPQQTHPNATVAQPPTDPNVAAGQPQACSSAAAGRDLRYLDRESSATLSETTGATSDAETTTTAKTDADMSCNRKRKRQDNAPADNAQAKGKGKSTEGNQSHDIPDQLLLQQLQAQYSQISERLDHIAHNTQTQDVKPQQLTSSNNVLQQLLKGYQETNEILCAIGNQSKETQEVNGAMDVDSSAGGLANVKMKMAPVTRPQESRDLARVVPNYFKEVFQGHIEDRSQVDQYRLSRMPSCTIDEFRLDLEAPPNAAWNRSARDVFVTAITDQKAAELAAFKPTIKDLHRLFVSNFRNTRSKYRWAQKTKLEWEVIKQEHQRAEQKRWIQALRQSVSGAKAMRYRDQQTQELLAEMQEYTSPRDHVYKDIFSGIDYLKLYQISQLTEDDTLVNFSMDGAQLYQNKKSDTWIAIWIVQDYDPKTQFKRKHVLPALIVPGPKKPKNLDSYTYRSMHHLSAIQREDGGRGIKCWDGEKGTVISSRTALYLNMADTVGLIDIDGRVPHHGARGCRVACDMLGRHKPGQGHYYAVHLQPFNYGDVPECNHGDVDTENIKSATIEQYHIDLALVEASANLAEYEQNRYRTGISKRSIISGLVKELTLPPPKSFSVDLMHLFWINLGELMVPLFRGKLKCENTDDIKSWDWAVLQGPNWTNFGKLVADSTVHFPSSFERPPRNPAEKINSKYKATEYFLLLFGLGPGLLRFFLPRSYWRHFCKLVRSVRILTQRRISYDQLVDARHFAIQFVDEYEVFYYQRRVDRMHFCRPVLHTLLHVPLETKRVGPGAYYTQFENERAIGDFGKEIRQPSNPFGNLAQIAVRQARKNALKVIYPDLDSEKQLPRGSMDLKNGYILLTPRTGRRARVHGAAGAYLYDQIGTNSVRKYGRLRLPNGQVLRSVFAESSLIKREPRISRNAKLSLDGATEFAEVEFFFLQVVGYNPATQTDIKVPKALVSIYSPRMDDIWEDSYKTLWPIPSLPADPLNLLCVIEKSGMEDMVLSGYSEPLD
ncbi:hypothetical protein EST38_g13914 [Candolleomyces aberdarensis]|uniref:Uncharacterized protein n=1 Tax=Candolleomyces aberdarensis TaxID=2316362 RepID=A0A4Q2D119_9AGAR|nr:hypothetical protein EST38_g13914 [Candolleomyces aberdarensis]